MRLSQFWRDLATSFCLWGKQLVNGQLGPNSRSEQWLSPHPSPNYCLGQMHKASKLSSFLGGFPGVKSTLTELLKQKVPWTTLKTVTQRHREVSYSSSIKNLTNCTSDFCFYFFSRFKKKKKGPPIDDDQDQPCQPRAEDLGQQIPVRCAESHNKNHRA